MRSHTAHSSSSTRNTRHAQAGQNALNALPADGALPSYCERKPAAVLDDGWIGDTLEAADDIDSADVYDDFYDDSGDLEDSR